MRHCSLTKILKFTKQLADIKLFKGCIACNQKGTVVGSVNHSAYYHSAIHGRKGNRISYQFLITQLKYTTYVICLKFPKRKVPDITVENKIHSWRKMNIIYRIPFG